MEIELTVNTDVMKELFRILNKHLDIIEKLTLRMLNVEIQIKNIWAFID